MCRLVPVDLWITSCTLCMDQSCRSWEGVGRTDLGLASVTRTGCKRVDSDIIAEDGWRVVFAVESALQKRNVWESAGTGSPPFQGPGHGGRMLLTSS